MAHLRMDRCNKHGKCPCTKEIASAIPFTAEAAKNAILPNVQYLQDLAQPIINAGNYSLAKDLIGILTIEGSNIIVNLGAFSISNDKNLALIIKNCDNIIITGGTIIGNMLIENCNNVKIENIFINGDSIINNSTFSYLTGLNMNSLEISDLNTGGIFTSTINGKLILKNCKNMDIKTVTLLSTSGDIGLYMYNVTLSTIINFILNGNNVGTKAVVCENCDGLVIRLLNAKNFTNTYVEFDQLTNSVFGESLFSVSCNGVVATNCNNLTCDKNHIYNISGDGIKLVNCSLCLCYGNIITGCNRGICVDGDDNTIENNIITKCKYGIINKKECSNIFFSNKCSLSVNHNYKHVPHIDVSSKSACEINQVGSLTNVGFV